MPLYIRNWNQVPAKEGLGLLVLGLKRLFSTRLTGVYFFADYLFQILVLLIIGFLHGSSGYLDSRNLAWRYLPWYLLQCGSVALTWAYGYMTIDPDTPKRHLRFAIFRLTFCYISVLFFLYERFVVHYRHARVNTLILVLVVLSAVLHHRGAAKRISWYQAQHEAGMINPWENTINDMTGSTMRYTSSEQKIALRKEALEYMKGNVDRNAFWYHPLVTVESASGQDISNCFDSSLFSTCYCCLDSDACRIMSSSVEDQTLVADWENQRKLFLKQPTQGHKRIPQSPPSSHPDLVENRFVPHTLCSRCRWVCGNSYLIALQSGWTWKTFQKYINYALSKDLMVEEYFEHSLNPFELQREANLGCHLCSLIWNSMNRDQQEELLTKDEKLSNALAATLSSLQVDETEQEMIRQTYRRKRAIRIKIQSPQAQREWTYPWRLRHSKYALRLIPHFGEQQLARRWMKKKFALCAVSVDKDPTMEWDREHVDPIEICSTNLDNSGPIELPVSFSTDSDITMSFIKSWLQKHVHNTLAHTDEGLYEDDPRLNSESSNIFMSNLENPFLPTRLVDVGKDDSSIRICLSSEIPRISGAPASQDLSAASNQYVALSHCWGLHKFIVLQQASLSGFRKNIPHEILTPTFRDAIRVTRKLGLRFIWIDSLCIIQDSDGGKDWFREAARMKDVYSNALFVLAAASAWDCFDGLFAKQVPLNMNPCLVGTKGVISESTGNNTNSFGGIYALPSNKFTSDAWEEIEFSKLSTRAWCFQEEALAQRLVYFGDHQIMLRCRECKTSDQQVDWEGRVSRGSNTDRYPNLLYTHYDIFSNIMAAVRKAVLFYWDKMPMENLFHNRKYRKNTQFLLSSQASEVPSQKDSSKDAGVLLRYTWWDDVLGYSSRNLTKEADKLEALAGIASRYQVKASVSTNYLAGLWKSYLAMGLLWYVSRNRSDRRSQPYRAPSWSWASVDGHIRNNSLQGGDAYELSNIDILDVDVVGPSLDDADSEKFPLGVVNGGFLHVRGDVKRATWRAMPLQESKYYAGHRALGNSPQEESDLGEYVSISSDSKVGPAVRSLHSQSGEQVGYLIPDTEDDIPAEIHCLRISVQPETRADQENFDVPWVTRGLALVHVPVDGTVNRYRRVGYVEINRTHGGFSIPSPFFQPWKSSLRSSDARAIRWPAPNLDVNHFFDDCEPKQIFIV